MEGFLGMVLLCSPYWRLFGKRGLGSMIDS